MCVCAYSIKLSNIGFARGGPFASRQICDNIVEATNKTNNNNNDNNGYHCNSIIINDNNNNNNNNNNSISRTYLCCNNAI